MEQIEPLLGPEKPLGTPGRLVVPFRRVLDGILYVLRTGCQWKAAPTEFGSGSPLHRRFQQWVEAGVFQEIGLMLLEEYDDRRGIKWRWPSLDSVITKAPLGGEQTGPNPTDRGKSGTKRHVLSDQRGAPWAVRATGAERHDMQVALDTLDAIVVERPRPRPSHQQHLCLDKGYDYDEIEDGVRERHYVPDIEASPVQRKETAASQTMGRRADALVAQPLSPAAGALGEESPAFSGACSFGLRVDCLPVNSFGMGS